MLRALILALLIFFGGVFNVNAQGTERSKAKDVQVLGDTPKVTKSQKVYDPRIASKRSAILPGLGQIYNDSWWKVPILYAGFGVSAYFIGFNNRQFKLFKEEAEALLLIQEMQALTATQQNQLRVARRQADQWRENRDLVYLTTLGIYALNIIEATIDAHLKGFNVDDNLALNLKPKIGVISNGAAYIGVGLTFSISK